jgi:hypothetical protein
MNASTLSQSAPAVLFSDVDDTITWHGSLPVEALATMHALHDRGVELVLVTGACAGSCEQMARTWPVAAVIGENAPSVCRVTPIISVRTKTPGCRNALNA